MLMKKYHLAILKKPYLDAILSGQKKVESRFTLTKREPFGQIAGGDKIFFKLSSGVVCAVATVSAVKTFVNLCPYQTHRLKAQYNDLILGSDEYWESKLDSKFGVLVWLEDVKAIEPVRIDKKDWRAWVVLKKGKDFGLLK